MIRIYIIADSFKDFNTPIFEYNKRLWKNVSIIKIKPSKKGSHQDIINKDTEKVNSILKKLDWDNILLSTTWISFNTENFTNKVISKSFNKWKQINFIIWWAFWLNENNLININLKLKLSDFTLPHLIALTVLLEQIYRSYQILRNRNYHY